MSKKIGYVKVVCSDNWRQISVVDDFSSLIWHKTYYGVGDFEIYIKSTPEMRNILAIGNYVVRDDDDDFGIIEKIEITYDIDEGTMITASGRFGKSIIDRRHIMQYNGATNSNKPTIFYAGANVETIVRTLVRNNATYCTWDTLRNIPCLHLNPTPKEYTETISGDIQVSYANLMEYTDNLLKTYYLASRVIIGLYDDSGLKYDVYKGTNRTRNNSDNNEPVIFSKEYGNLLNSNYSYDASAVKNTFYIGGAGEDVNRFFTELVSNESNGINRRESFYNASSINRSYKDENDVEQTYGVTVYKNMLINDAMQTYKETEFPIISYSGDIDVLNTQYEYGKDFFVGDMITIEDEYISISARIMETTEIQDANGYQVTAHFERDL